MSSTLPYEADAILNRLGELGVIGLAPAWEPLAGGTVNSVWRAHAPGGDPLIVRIGPPPDVVREGPSWLRGTAIACETIVLDRIRPIISCVPAPVAAGFRQPERPWLVQTTVPGQPFAGVLPLMDTDSRAAVWRQVGTLLRHLQAIEVSWFGTPDGRCRYPDWVSMVRADAEGLLDDAHRYGLATEPFERLLADIDVHADALREVRAPAIVHSDLDPRHVFVQQGSEGWGISGVIDWEYARYADPLSEIVIVGLLARPEDDPDRQAFLQGYGVDAHDLTEPSMQARQSIYRGVAEGWAITDAARLAR